MVNTGPRFTSLDDLRPTATAEGGRGRGEEVLLFWLIILCLTQRTSVFKPSGRRVKHLNFHPLMTELLHLSSTPFSDPNPTLYLNQLGPVAGAASYDAIRPTDISSPSRQYTDSTCRKF